MNPKYLMDTFNIGPKKSLGQNFLHDPNTLEKIVATAEISPNDTVVEVGPGTGALTVYLAQIASRMLAIEIDNRLIPVLQQQLRDFPNVEIVHSDILETDVEQLVGEGEYIVVGNLPYYITSAILRHLLDKTHKPKRLIMTVQQEVAERLVAQPGDMSSVGSQCAILRTATYCQQIESSMSGLAPMYLRQWCVLMSTQLRLLIFRMRPYSFRWFGVVSAKSASRSKTLLVQGLVFHILRQMHY